MEDLATRLCWKLVNKEGYIAIWQKPLNNTCYVSRDEGIQPPLCDANDDPDDVWYVPLKACITQLPENGFGRNLTKWPERLHISPDRLEVAPVDAYVAKKELFVAEQNYNRFLVESYWHGLGWKRQHFRNVMDMRAGFGGFATALVDLRVDCWVMNVVPVSGPNTLPVIYDRGLIGVVHDWCEPFDTYPRTYDLLHASGLFSIEEKRCNIADILLEMDRIMRPGAHAYIRDTRAVIAKIEVVAKAIGWRTRTFDTEEGPYASRKVLGCEKM
uniref:Methyltransferase n=1 Tax=Wollemia nobilis TaxID=56998 RepID=A0A0C9RNM4_9CONI